jgi:hypothetical protein
MKRMVTVRDLQLRARSVAATLVLAGVVIALLAGAVSSGASASTSGRISAHLTSTSFTAAQASGVKLVYRFSSRSSRFGYVLSRSQGSQWVTVRSVSKRGSFTGSHTMTAKQLFGTKPIRIAQYRVKLSASANSVTLKFRVVNPSGTVVPPSSVVPQAGNWTVLAGESGGNGSDSFNVNSVAFTVAPDHTTVSNFGFEYTYSGIHALGRPSCVGVGQGFEAASASSPITNGQFSTPPDVTWSGDGSATFQGTFDSATRAHGTVLFRALISDFNCQWTGEVNGTVSSWTATPG